MTLPRGISLPENQLSRPALCSAPPGCCHTALLPELCPGFTWGGDRLGGTVCITGSPLQQLRCQEAAR